MPAVSLVEPIRRFYLARLALGLKRRQALLLLRVPHNIGQEYAKFYIKQNAETQNGNTDTSAQNADEVQEQTVSQTGDVQAETAPVKKDEFPNRKRYEEGTL